MRLSAPLSVLMFCVTSASAQTAGEVRDLRLSTRDLIFRVEDLTPRIKSIAFTETRTETRIALPADILFDFDKADIRKVAEPALKQAADLIRQSAKGTVRIEGYTDSKGGAAYNLKLSDRRAASVKNWLVEHEGLKQVSFQTKGFGAANQVAPNAKPDGSDDPEGRLKNRRVEIVFSRQAK